MIKDRNQQDPQPLSSPQQKLKDSLILKAQSWLPGLEGQKEQVLNNSKMDVQINDKNQEPIEKQDRITNNNNQSEIGTLVNGENQKNQVLKQANDNDYKNSEFDKYFLLNPEQPQRGHKNTIVLTKGPQMQPQNQAENSDEEQDQERFHATLSSFEHSMNFKNPISSYLQFQQDLLQDMHGDPGQNHIGSRRIYEDDDMHLLMVSSKSERLEHQVAPSDQIVFNDKNHEYFNQSEREQFSQLRFISSKNSRIDFGSGLSTCLPSSKKQSLRRHDTTQPSPVENQNAIQNKLDRSIDYIDQLFMGTFSSNSEDEQYQDNIQHKIDAQNKLLGETPSSAQSQLYSISKAQLPNFTSRKLSDKMDLFNQESQRRETVMIQRLTLVSNFQPPINRQNQKEEIKGSALEESSINSQYDLSASKPKKMSLFSKQIAHPSMNDESEIKSILESKQPALQLNDEFIEQLAKLQNRKIPERTLNTLAKSAKQFAEDNFLIESPSFAAFEDPKFQAQHHISHQTSIMLSTLDKQQSNYFNANSMSKQPNCVNYNNKFRKQSITIPKSERQLHQESVGIAEHSNLQQDDLIEKNSQRIVERQGSEFQQLQQKGFNKFQTGKTVQVVKNKQKDPDSAQKRNQAQILIEQLLVDRDFNKLMSIYPHIKAERLAIFYVRNDQEVHKTQRDIFKKLGLLPRKTTKSFYNHFQTDFKKGFNCEEFKLQDKNYEDVTAQQQKFKITNIKQADPPLAHADNIDQGSIQIINNPSIQYQSLNHHTLEEYQNFHHQIGHYQSMNQQQSQIQHPNNPLIQPKRLDFNNQHDNVEFNLDNLQQESPASRELRKVTFDERNMQENQQQMKTIRRSNNQREDKNIKNCYGLFFCCSSKVKTGEVQRDQQMVHQNVGFVRKYL
eukprot:403359744